MRSPNESLRLGCVQYLNARPLIYGWNGAVTFDHPAILCRKLAAGELDVAFVSSFEYLRQPTYSIVDQVAVGADGAVESVFVAFRGDLRAVKEIMLDPASLTSVNLLRVLLTENDLKPALVPLSAAATITESRARLLIGDQAIRFRAENGNAFAYWDLGAVWKETAGLPFVFALWLIRPGLPEANTIANRLRVQRDKNLQQLDQLIANEPEFSPEFCQHYFRDCLRFQFGEREKEGLLRFRSLCEKHEILPPQNAPLRLV